MSSSCRYFKFLGMGREGKVMLGSEALQPVAVPQLADASASAYAYDSNSESLLVKVFYSYVPSGSRSILSIL